MTAPLIPVVLAGGSGTRLWPLSRKNYPKQFLTLHGESSLLQQTVERATALPYTALLTISNQSHYFLCQEQLNTYAADITYLLEPCARNTAPAIAATAHYIVKHHSPDAIMVILPSDHWITPVAEWQTAMLQGVALASSQDLIVTFGIKPTEPTSAYGYIETSSPIDKHAFSVHAFREKPDLQTAKQFVISGKHYWNSGMFVCKAKTYLDELNKHAPELYTHSLDALEKGTHANDYLRLNEQAFSQCKNDSIDYVIMEKTKLSALSPLNILWSDLGSWSAVAEATHADENGNTLQGNVIVKNSRNCLINSKDALVTTIGLQDQIIIATKDAILVAHKNHSQDVKDLVNQFDDTHRNLADEHARVYRPWGYYEVLAEGATFKVKRLMVKPGAALSLQMHYHRAEHWVVVGGVATVINHEDTISLSVNQSTYIPKQTRHRLSNQNEEPLYVIEVQSGDYLGEDDIVRFDDIYERVEHHEASQSH